MRFRAWVPQVLRAEPRFRLLFGSQVLSVFGDRVTTVALPFAVLAAGGGLGEVAAVSAAQFVPFVLLALPAGVWADRLNRKVILIVSDAVRLVCQAIAAALLLTGVAEPAHLMVTAALYGAADAFFAPAFSGLLPATVSAGNLQPANALRGFSYSAGNIVGPALAGLLIVVSGPGGALAFDALTFAASILLLLRLKLAAVEAVPPPGETTGERFWESLRNGWTEVRSRSWVLGFLGAMSSYHLVVLPSIFVLGPVLMDEEYAGARSWALITTCFGVGSLVGDVLFLRWRPRHAMRVAALALLVSSCQAAVIGSGLPVWAMGILIGFCGVGVAGAFTLWSTSLAEHVPNAALSRVSSYDYLVTAGAIPLGNIVAGIVGGAVGLRPTLLAMTAIGAAVCLVVATLRSVRQLPRAAPTLRQ